MQLIKNDTVTNKESGDYWQEHIKLTEAEIEKTVVVIGAGCAGLECAQMLYANGKQKRSLYLYQLEFSSIYWQYIIAKTKVLIAWWS